MPKYLSGRAKVTPQSKLSSDRYKYLDLGSAEPNLGTPPSGGSPDLPSGEQYQIVSVIDDDNEVNRYWVPIQGGLIPGSISIFEEGSLVGTASSVTQLNFVGNAITADAAPYSAGVNAGTIATMTVAPPGNNDEVLFKSSGDFAASSNLLFNSTAGILTSKEALNVGLGGTVLTVYSGTSSGVGVASVGIGTTNPSRALHVRGDLRLTGTIYDGDNTGGDTGDLIVKAADGTIEWKAPETVQAGAGGAISQIQYHDDTGLVEGASNFVWIEATQRIGIGSLIPRANLLMDVVGVASFSNIEVAGLSTFTGPVGFTSDIKIAGITTISSLTNKEVVHVGAGSSLIGNSKFTFEVVNAEGFTKLTVNDLTEVKNLNVTGVATIGYVEIGGADDYTIKTTSGNLKLNSTGGTIRAENLISIVNDNEAGDYSTGALQVDGGGHFDKSLLVGGGLSVVGGAGTNISPGAVIGVGVTLASSRGITTTGGDLYVGGVLYADDIVGGAAGSDTEVQYNNGGVLGGMSELTYNDSTGDITISGASYNAIWDKSANALEFQDEARANFGTNNDLQISHTNSLASQNDSEGNSVVDGWTSYIHENGTGGLVFKTDGNTGEGAYQFFDAGWRPIVRLFSGTSARAVLYHGGVEKFVTTATGTEVTGVHVDDGATHDGDVTFTGATKNVVWDKSDNALEFVDDAKAIFGTSGDLEIYYTEGDGSNGGSVFKHSGDHDMRFQVPSGAHDIVFETTSGANLAVYNANAGIELHWRGASGAGQKFETTTDGVKITGGIQDKDGQLGTANQLLSSTGTELDWINATDVVGGAGGSDTEVQYNNGGSLGGMSELTYNDSTGDITISGASKTVVWDKSANSFIFADNAKAIFGTDADFEIYYDHDSTGHSVLHSGAKTISIRSGNTVEIEDESGNSCAEFHSDGNVELFWRGASGAGKKFETTTDGVKITGGIQDKDGDLGSSSQLLSSTGTELNWVNPQGLSVENADKIKIQEKNDSVTYQVPFSAANGTGYQSLYIDTDDAHLTYNPALGTLSATNLALGGTLDVTGTATFAGIVVLEDGLKDKDGDLGSSGDVLTSTGSKTNWASSSTVGKTYTLEGVDSGDNAILRLSDGSTNDDVTITAGTNITIDPVAAGGFTIAAVQGAGLALNATVTDVLDISSGTLSADDPGADRIIFWDESETKLTHLTVGTGLQISGTTITATTDAGKTYTLEGVDSGSNAILRLSDGTTDDDVTITAGTGITLDPVAAGGFTISANSAAGKTYTLEGVDSGSNAILRLSDGSANDDVTITAGTGITIDPVAAGGFTIAANSSAGKTYTLEGVDSGDNAILRLSDGSVNDDVTITAGANITIDPVAAGGFTIAAVQGAGLALDSTVTDVLDLGSGTLSADDPGADRIIFWDETAGKLTHLTAGSGLTISGTTITANSDAGKTYTLEGVDSGDNAILRLSDGTTDDDVTITAGTNITIDSVAAGGFTISADAQTGTTYDLLCAQTGGTNDNPAIRLDPSTGANDDITIVGGTNCTVTRDSDTQLTISVDAGAAGVSDVQVSYTGRSAPCTLPITVTGTATKTINIPSSSNAFGAKYVQTSEPTGSSVCEGDIWYDTSASETAGIIPLGGIILWSGDEDNIPTNWALCNGATHGSLTTPDLRDKFVIGAQSWSTAGSGRWETNITGSGTQTGGHKNAVLIAHEHKAPTYNGGGGPYEPGYQNPTTGYDYGAQAPPSEKTAVDVNGTTTTGASATQTGTNANLPPYYALAYIMRIT